MSDYKPGQAYFGYFPTADATGESADADSLPTATAVRNGVDDAWALTVGHAGTGRYTITGTVPGTYADGDRLQIRVEAVIGGLTTDGVVDNFAIRTIDNNALLAAIGALQPIVTVAPVAGPRFSFVLPWACNAQPQIGPIEDQGTPIDLSTWQKLWFTVKRNAKSDTDPGVFQKTCRPSVGDFSGGLSLYSTGTVLSIHHDGVQINVVAADTSGLPNANDTISADLVGLDASGEVWRLMPGKVVIEATQTLSRS